MFAEWAYAKTLLALRKGDEGDARTALAAAWKRNPHVPALLTGAMPIPEHQDDHYTLGSSDEAVIYVLQNRENWTATRGEDEGGTGGGEVEHIQEKIAVIQGRRERFEEHRDALAASGEGQLSLTDPDSRAMHAATRVGVGYNIQIAVDAKHKLIAEQQVHNKASDLGLLAETAVAARRNLAVDRIDAVADAGYFKIEDIEACENAGVMPHVPKPQRGSTVSQGLFPKERFRYDGGEDIYIWAPLRIGELPEDIV